MNYGRYRFGVRKFCRKISKEKGNPLPLPLSFTNLAVSQTVRHSLFLSIKKTPHTECRAFHKH